ncbi:pyrimidine-specific ribonucleoside hydrolase RihA-like [Uranotaenia lowii]|uniref:pyrimidine-specific ribonucleoside hydrolase RihA-like n=1 Tax=Uranotaenia lowii TaxID=190385 RepID=UPI00247B28A7|nr:pyrimidine-specific ribonucleoside hydrolase RihA-like [Uranotaenia lowii]
MWIVGLVLVSLAVGVPAACPSSRQTGSSGVRRVIIDLDAGGDDAWALTMLLMDEAKYNVCVQAITCTHGNTDVDNVAKNVARILDGLGRTDIPVYKGAQERLITPAPSREISQYFWGVDGFGDVHFAHTPSLAVIKSGHAVDRLNELFLKYPGEITILCVGPLTNLALLFKLYPDTKHNIAGIYILGGNRNGVGNTDLAAEFNFFGDPEAANIVVNNAPVVMNIFPWETILSLSEEFTTQWRFKEFVSTPNPAIQVLNQVEEVIYANLPGWTPCDMYLAAIFLNPKLIDSSVRYKADVELNGRLTRGMLAIQYHVQDEKLFNVNIIDTVDEDVLREMVINLNREPPKIAGQKSGKSRKLY